MGLVYYTGPIFFIEIGIEIVIYMIFIIKQQRLTGGYNEQI